jgi:hypothetical protein
MDNSIAPTRMGDSALIFMTVWLNFDFFRSEVNAKAVSPTSRIDRLKNEPNVGSYISSICRSRTTYWGRRKRPTAERPLAVKIDRLPAVKNDLRGHY